MKKDHLKEGTPVQEEERIKKIRKSFGKELFIPAHHYQKDEIVSLADCTGDSLELSKAAATTEAKYIVFCGVRFMAETARVLSGESKSVFIPRDDAGCPLADFGKPEAIDLVWQRLDRLYPGEYIPVTYVNSHVEVKAFCGKNGGLVCTSSNAERVFRKVLMNNKRVFFMPDKNLGINTARKLGMEKEYEIVGGPESEGQLAGRPIVIWNGYCYVHRVFTEEHVSGLRKKYPGIKVIVHPECDPGVVSSADIVGSTSRIKRTIEESGSGSEWAVGTEYTFVMRLQQENRDKMIRPLAVSTCEDMAKTGTGDLLRTLECLGEEDCSGQVRVSRSAVDGAKKAIIRMLELE